MTNPTLPSSLPRRYLLTGGHVYSPVDPFATAMMVVDGQIVWIGSDAGAAVHRDSVDTVIGLDGCLVTPAFVDAHVHTTATGLGMIGMDLRGIMSGRDLLERVRDHCAGLDQSEVVWGHGWDDTAWPDDIPTRRQLDEACGDRLAYLSRIDVHSGLVSSELVRRCTGIDTASGFDPFGPLRMDAHLRARTITFDSLALSQRRQAQSAALTDAARHGIASLHEMAGPGISSDADLRALLDIASDPTRPEVVGYWGAIDAIDEARELGAIGCAGDLFIDGSIGSHTACLRHPYADDETTSGVSYLTREQVVDHIVECTRANMQAGFHVIGDQAMDIVCDGIISAAKSLGPVALRRGGHRLEHTEMMDERHRQVLAELNVTASMQPAFDSTWGGDRGMYALRLGTKRAAELNPFASALAAGVSLAFGSDSPVTPLRPWDAVRAAVYHHTPRHRISARAAFLAHTRGGRRAARQDAIEPGILQENAPATFAIWRTGDLVVSAPDSRIASWSTDPRSGTPGLPDLNDAHAAPECLLTTRAGTIVHHIEASRSETSSGVSG